MKNNKKDVHILIDSDLWEIAKVVLPCSRTEFLEKQLRNYINSTDEIEQLREEIEESKEETRIKEEKLTHLIEVKELRSKNKENIETALNTVRKIFFNNGVVTYSQIKFIANRENISEDILIKECKNNKIKVLKIYQN